MQDHSSAVIHDESSDRKYFTTVPNFVVDHVGMEAQSLYLTMKRYAGESGSCFASERTLRGKMRAGKIAMKRGLNELLEAGLIAFKGMQMVETDGGMQMVKAYVITDIWKKNVDHYQESKGVLKSDHLGMLKTEALPESAHLEAPNGGLRPAENGRQGLLKSAPKKNHILKKNHLREHGGKPPTPADTARAFFEKGDPYQKCIEALSQKTSPGTVAAELEKFIEYWTEPNKSGTKVRWEQQETFEIGRRLKTWFGRVKNYQNNKDRKEIIV